MTRRCENATTYEIPIMSFRAPAPWTDCLTVRRMHTCRILPHHWSMVVLKLPLMSHSSMQKTPQLACGYQKRRQFSSKKRKLWRRLWVSHLTKRTGIHPRSQRWTRRSPGDFLYSPGILILWRLVHAPECRVAILITNDGKGDIDNMQNKVPNPMSGLNAWPSLPGLKPSLGTYSWHILMFACIVIKLSTRVFDLPATYFDHMVMSPGAMCRILHNLPTSTMLGIAAYRNIKCFTILCRGYTAHAVNSKYGRRVAGCSSYSSCLSLIWILEICWVIQAMSYLSARQVEQLTEENKEREVADTILHEPQLQFFGWGFRNMCSRREEEFW